MTNPSAKRSTLRKLNARAAARLKQCSLHDLAKSERGGIAVLGALLMTGVIGCAAMAVDVGALSKDHRSLQSALDSAALAAVVPIAQSQSSGVLPNTTRLSAIVAAAVAGNGYPQAVIDSVVPGTYCPDLTLAPSARFTPGAASCAPGVYSGPVPNAVTTTAHVTSPYYLSKAFMGGQTGETLNVSSTAAGLDEAGFSIGTGLISASTANSPLLNAVLGGMLNTNLSLSAVSYDGLANAQINALSLLNNIATNASVNVGTIGGLANASATLGTVLQAEASVLSSAGTLTTAQAAALNGLQLLQAAIYGQPSVSVGNLLNVGAWQTAQAGYAAAPSALQATVNVLQVATAAIQLSGGGHAATIQASGLGLPGLSALTVSATAGSPMTNGYIGSGDGYVGASASTSQVAIGVGLTPAPVSVGVPGVAAVQVSLALPLNVSIANGTASLSSVACSTNAATDSTMTVTGSTGVATLDATLTAKVAVQVLGLNVLTTNITVPLNVQVGSSGPTPLTFTQSDVQNQVVKRISSTDLLSTTTASLMSSLSSQAGAKINVQLLGLNLPALNSLAPLVSSAVSLALTPLAATLDTVIDTTAAALGVQVGYMDVMATGVRCGVPALTH